MLAGQYDNQILLLYLCEPITDRYSCKTNGAPEISVDIQAGIDSNHHGDNGSPDDGSTVHPTYDIPLSLKCLAFLPHHNQK